MHQLDRLQIPCIFTPMTRCVRSALKADKLNAVFDALSSNKKEMCDMELMPVQARTLMLMEWSKPKQHKGSSLGERNKPLPSC